MIKHEIPTLQVPWGPYRAKYTYLATRFPVYVNYDTLPSFPSLVNVDPNSVIGYIGANLNDSRLPLKNALIIDQLNNPDYPEQVQLVSFAEDSFGMVTNYSDFLKSQLRKSKGSEGGVFKSNSD